MFENKNCIYSPVQLNRSKNSTSVQPFDLTVRQKICIRSAVRPCHTEKICTRLPVRPQPFEKKLHPFSRSTLPFEKNLHPFSRSTDPFRMACLAVSYPFACRAFSRSNGYRKERFRVRGHKYFIYKCQCI